MNIYYNIGRIQILWTKKGKIWIWIINNTNKNKKYTVFQLISSVLGCRYSLTQRNIKRKSSHGVCGYFAWTFFNKIYRTHTSSSLSCYIDVTWSISLYKILSILPSSIHLKIIICIWEPLCWPSSSCFPNATQAQRNI